jgi:hypothetical protein
MPATTAVPRERAGGVVGDAGDEKGACMAVERCILGFPGPRATRLRAAAGFSPRPNAFDPYREALVVEQQTVWPDSCEDWSDADKDRVAALLHASPREAAELDYVRQHTGFARVITVTPADLDRVSVA